MLKSFALAAAFTATSLSAQSTNVVFPMDRATAEGLNNNVFPLGRASMRYQQIELQAKGKTFVLRGIEFRRDGNSASTIGARMITATILVGDGNGSAFTTTYGNNWVGTPTTVANAQTFSLPPLPRPTTPPAPFLVKLPFSNVTAHTGQNELLWEMAVTSSASASYVCDAHSTGNVRGTFRTLGQGCTTSGTARFTLLHSFRAALTATELLYGASRAPANLPVIALIGAVNPDLQLPGACTKLYTVPVVSLPLGTSSATGSVANQWFGLGPWNPSWAGAKLYSQAFAPDPTQPTSFSLSQGRELTLPTTGPQAEAQKRLFATSSTATSGTIGNGYGLVVRFP